MQFANILPLTGIRQLFTYSVSSSYAAEDLIGYRSIIPFRNTLQAGIILEVRHKTPDYKVKPLLNLPDRKPLLDRKQLSFLRWMASYYLCDLQEAVHTALSAIQPFLAPRIRLSSAYKKNLAYSTIERNLLSCLNRSGSLSGEQAQRIIGKDKDLIAVLTPLLEHKAVTLADSLRKCLPKKKQIRLDKRYNDANAFAKLQSLLAKQPKQKAIVGTYLRHTGHKPLSPSPWLTKTTLLAQDISPNSLRTLLKKNIFVEREKPISPFSLPSRPIAMLDETVQEAKCLQAMHDEWTNHKVILLQGNSCHQLTKLSLQIAAQGLQTGTILYLVPTIKQVTLQLPQLNKLFGTHYGVYHAERTPIEKISIHDALQNDKLRLVVGTRSALFLPFQKLQGIIVTEEENEAYKQTLKNPRYHVRDAAIVLAQEHDAHVLLTSATPSLISYHNAQKKKYGFVSFTAESSTAPIRLIALPRKKHPASAPPPLAPAIVSLIKRAYKEKKQSVVLHHRKGYAAYMRCRDCYWLPTCPQCARSLAYHQTTYQLHCHYCRHLSPPPSNCLQCSSPRLQYQKTGTQQVEEWVQFYLSDATIRRIDGDIVKSNKKYVKVLDEFKAKRIDILVTTPGIINLLPVGEPCLINLLGIEDWFTPGFTAYEKTYQTLCKLSDPTIATSLAIQSPPYINPEIDRLARLILHREHTPIYHHALKERRAYGYPPYVRLVRVVFLHKDIKELIHLAETCFSLYKLHLGVSMIGPTPPGKTKKEYSTEIWLKLPKDRLADSMKQEAYNLACDLLIKKDYRHTHLIFDVDPI